MLATPTASGTAGGSPAPLPATAVLLLGDSRGASAIGLQDEDLAIAFGGWRRFEELPRRGAHGVDHAQGGAWARCPLVALREGGPRRRECHLRAEARHREHDAEAEAAAQPQFAIDREIGGGGGADATAHTPDKWKLAEARPELRRPDLVEPVALAVVHVLDRARSGAAAGEEQRDDCTAERQYFRPETALERRKARVGAVSAFRDARKLALDSSLSFMETVHRGSFPERSWSWQTTTYPRKEGSVYALCTLKCAKSWPGSAANWELHPNEISDELAADLERLDRRFATNPTR